MSMGSVGRPSQRVDARAKVTGEAVYAVDVARSGMLYGHVLRSDRAHARILDIDTSEARSVPGVAAIVTAADLAGLFRWFGHIIADHPILAIERVRYFGEPVAVVAAEELERRLRVVLRDVLADLLEVRQRRLEEKAHAGGVVDADGAVHVTAVRDVQKDHGRRLSVLALHAVDGACPLLRLFVQFPLGVVRRRVARYSA